MRPALLASLFAAALLAQDLVYVCPMDADVRSSSPGNCARCGMKLRAGIPAPVEYPMDLNVAPRPPRAGAASRLEFTVRNPWNGAAVKKFQTVHEQLFHLFVVGQDLEYFAHEHPLLQQDGRFRLDVAFPKAGMYRLMGDFFPDGGSPQMNVKTLIVPGTAPPAAAALSRDYSAKDAANLKVELATEPPQPVPGTKTILFFRVTPVDGMEPYLGAWGHLLAASDDLMDLLHEHPYFPDGPPRIQFNVIFPRARVYRVWVQFQRNGVVNTAHFDVPVRALE